MQAIILAAGMGSRYGGLKQIDGVGNHNEPIIEFTIFDAIKTGFKKDSDYENAQKAMETWFAENSAE